MAEAKRKPVATPFVSPFADASRTEVKNVTADLSDSPNIPSPAKLLQGHLEASLDHQAYPGDAAYSPRLVTSTVVTVCLAFWLAIYLAAAAVL